MKLNDEGTSVPKPARKAAKSASVKVPVELQAALQKSKIALAAFDGMSPSHRREYAEWVGEARREETKVKRVAQAVEWISEGKSRHWKYQDCCVVRMRQSVHVGNTEAPAWPKAR